MKYRRIKAHLEQQNWSAVFIDFAIVVIGVFIGMQVANWNADREASARRDMIVAAVITDMRSSADVHERFIREIDQGLNDWNNAFSAGDRPAPFVMRIKGSDTAPKTWETLQQMPLTDMFDPVTIFDLVFYYSELNGVGVKYIRYVSFVESDILPWLKGSPEVFYQPDGSTLLPQYAANMDRLNEYARESERMRRWNACLVYRLEAEETFAQNCRGADYRLPGMPAEME